MQIQPKQASSRPYCPPFEPSQHLRAEEWNCKSSWWPRRCRCGTEMSPVAIRWLQLGLSGLVLNLQPPGKGIAKLIAQIDDLVGRHWIELGLQQGLKGVVDQFEIS